MSSEKEGKEVVPVKVREEYMVSLLRELHDLFGKYYLDVFQKEETESSPVFSISDLRRNSLKMHYLHFFNDLYYWSRFLEIKSIMREK